jgi:predicted small secreted protein
VGSSGGEVHGTMHAAGGRMNARTENSHGIRWLPLFAAALVVSLMALTSCNTTAGLGRDMKKVGDKIEDTANRRL